MMRRSVALGVSVHSGTWRFDVCRLLRSARHSLTEFCKKATFKIDMGMSMRGRRSKTRAGSHPTMGAISGKRASQGLGPSGRGGESGEASGAA
jgi:hypothetical protein